MYTLNATEVHGVAYAFEPGIAKRDGSENRFIENATPTIRAKMGDNQTAVAYAIGNGQANQSFMTEQAGALNCMHDQQAVVVFDKEVYQSGEKCSGGHYIAEGGPAPTLRTTGHPPGVAAVDCRNGTENAHVNGTLQAKPNGGMSMNLNYVVRNEYIVRRLTPTECARLQGFPDSYGVVPDKEDLTDEEYEFWLKVRNTHAAINGKQVKDYTKQQMLTWYNKLHTDSAEYKMWGNGIALPCAEYVMRGIADALDS
jgi:DNA (cytosine-5)-methyltransferase 1